MNNEPLQIISHDDHHSACLRFPSPYLTNENWELAHNVAQKLLYVRNEVIKGGAGLAAPQIGINLPIFIYSPDRTTENIRVVINPSFKPVGDEKHISYEACFSVPLKCTKIPRWETILVTYQDLNKDIISAYLTSFAAKVFQHETDHIRGTLTVDHESAEVVSFPDNDTFKEYMTKVIKEDMKRY